MGHQRLGDIPKSQKWATVVASVASGGGGLGGGGSSGGYVADVADRTLDAAAAGLERAIGDEGLRFTFFRSLRLPWRPVSKNGRRVYVVLVYAFPMTPPCSISQARCRGSLTTTFNRTVEGPT